MGTINRMLNPVSHVKNDNPVTAYKRGKSEEGSWRDGVRDLLDPQGVVMKGNDRRINDAEARRKKESGEGKAEAKAYRAKMKAKGMKKGGKTSARACCKGMGAATRGGGYGK